MIHQFTADEIALLPAADVVQEHDAGEEAEPAFQDGLHRLAARCGACGQPLPEVIA